LKLAGDWRQSCWRFREAKQGGLFARVSHWVRPELVAEVKYLTWTDDNLLRQVVYVTCPRGQCCGFSLGDGSGPCGRAPTNPPIGPLAFAAPLPSGQ
jgi:hypothetical protein